MRKIILVLMMAMMLGACGESATDIVTGGGGGDGFIPPDTVIKTADGLFDIYRPGNPVAVETVQSLTPGAPLAGAIVTSETFGYTFDPARVAVATVTLADGRDVVVALGALLGADADGHVLYVRVGDREEALPLRVNRGSRDGFEVLESVDKGVIGPQGILWDLGHWFSCLMQAMADIALCYKDCEDCWRMCVYQALIRLLFCLQFTMI